MIDIHAHILPGVDDGAKTLHESMDMIRSAKEQGFQGIVLTPHFYPDNKMISVVAENKRRLKALKKAVSDEGIEIFLFLGNEVFYSQDMLGLLGRGYFVTINNSRYLLVETMRHSLDFYSLEVFLNNLHSKGYTPILAHPERYDFIQKDPNVLVRLVQDGNLAQMNILSLIGFYGKEAQATAKILLTHNMVHFLASDAHVTKAYDKFETALEAAIDLVGEKRVAKLLDENPKRVLVDEKVDIMEPCYYEISKKKSRNLGGLWKKQIQVV